MASNTKSKIAAEWKRIAGTGDLTHFPLMSGKVGSVDEDKATAMVKLTVNGGEVATEVLIDVKLNNVLGLLLIPAEGAECLVAEIDGGGPLELLKASEYSKIIMNGGENGGLINIVDLVTRLNNIEEDINELKTIFAVWTVSPGDGGTALRVAAADWYASHLVPTNVTDIEDPKVKH